MTAKDTEDEGTVQESAASVKARLVEEVELEKEGEKTYDVRKTEIVAEVIAGLSPAIEKGRQLSELIIGGSGVNKELLGDVFESEGQVMNVTNANTVEEKARAILGLIENFESRIATSGFANEAEGKQRKKAQERIVALKTALIEAGLKLMEGESSDFDMGFNFIKMSEINLGGFDGEVAWATERIAQALDKVKGEAGELLSDNTVESLAKVSIWGATGIVDIDGKYNGESENLRRIAEAKSYAMKRSEELERLRKESEFRNSWEVEKARADERNFGLSMLEAERMLKKLKGRESISFDKTAAGSYFLAEASTDRIENADQYILALSNLDEVAISETANRLSKEEVFFQTDSAGKSKEDYKRNFGDGWEEEWKKQIESSIKREMQGHLVGVFVATLDSGSVAFGDTVLGQRALEVLGKGKMAEVWDGTHEDKFLREMLVKALEDSGVKDFFNTRGGVELLVRSDLAFDSKNK